MTRTLQGGHMYADYLRYSFVSGFQTGLLAIVLITAVTLLISRSPFRPIHKSVGAVLFTAVFVPIFSFVLLAAFGVMDYHPIWMLGEGVALFMLDMLLYSVKQKRDAKSKAAQVP